MLSRTSLELSQATKSCVLYMGRKVQMEDLAVQRTIKTSRVKIQVKMTGIFLFQSREIDKMF